jgi:hypothetical protein
MRCSAYDIYQENILIVKFSSGRVLHFTLHERVGIQKKSLKACPRTEGNFFAAILRAGIFGWVPDLPAAGSFEFGFWGRVCLSPSQVHFPFLS